MYTNTDMTLYLYSKEGKTEKYTRMPIEKVYWEGVKQSTFLKTGQKDAHSAIIVIPLESLDRTLRFTEGKDLAVNGIIEDEIDCTSQDAMSKSLADLKMIHKYLTVATVDERLYGSKAMQHYKLDCV